MANQFEKQNMSFKKHTGTETEVRIVSETSITKGAFGNIYDAVIEIGGRKKRFIIKRYFNNLNRYEKPSATENAQLAFKNYALAKNAGLKVFPTFRIGEDMKSVLMTTGFSESQMCIGSNSKISIDGLKRPLIQEVENIEGFLKNCFNESIKAARKGIQLHHDVFFFILDKQEPTKIDFVLGDLDNLKEEKNTAYAESINIESAKGALVEFFIINADPEKKEEFLQKITACYNQVR